MGSSLGARGRGDHHPNAIFPISDWICETAPVQIDPALLKAFQSAAETLSFTAAAERLGVSQPRLSLLIRRLEEQLGLRLFVRAHRRVELTPEGTALLPKVEAMQAAMGEIDTLVAKLRGDSRGRLRLGSPTYSLAIPERQWFIEDFIAARPGVRLQVQSGKSMMLQEHLLNGQLDLALLTEPFDDRGLETTPFMACEVCIALPEEDPLAQADSIPLSAVAGRTLVTYPAFIGEVYYRRWFAGLVEAGAILTEAYDDHPAAVLKFGARRRLWSVFHRWEGQPAPISPEDRLVIRPLEDSEALQIRLRLARRQGLRSPAVNAFWRQAKAKMA
jgi:DNA-binding transcriptional LysR family regulator